MKVLIMTNHPRQRAMWDGLSASGCFGILILIAMITVIWSFS